MSDSNAKNLARLLNTDTTVNVSDIADGSVTSAKIGDGEVTVGKLESTLDLSSNTVTLPDGNITTAKLDDGAVTAGKLFSGFANGVTEADMWILTSNVTSTNDNVLLLDSNLSRFDSLKIGTGMSVSSGIWTFPTAGFWYVKAQLAYEQSGGDTSRQIGPIIYKTTDNSNYSQYIRGEGNIDSAHSSGQTQAVIADGFINVSDTSNVKIKIHTWSNDIDSTVLTAGTNYARSYFMFMRVGDSQ